MILFIKGDNIMEFTISDFTINSIRKKRILTIILSTIITVIICESLIFYIFVLKNISIKIFIVILSSTIILISFITYFSLKLLSIKILENMKEVKYILIDEDRIFIKQGEFEQINISKNEIKCTNRYKNRDVFIFLNSNKNIKINKYLDNYDQLIDNLNILSPINEINKKSNSTNMDWLIERFVIIIILFSTFILSILITKIFDINIPKFNRQDPMIILKIYVPLFLIAIFIVFISRKIAESIKSIKYILIILGIFSIVTIIVFFIIISK